MLISGGSEKKSAAELAAADAAVDEVFAADEVVLPLLQATAERQNIAASRIASAFFICVFLP